MALPRGNEYDQAVQMPQVSFTDTDLKISRVETNPLGLPKPYSGGFTTTFRLQSSNGDWAVRCFTREIQDLQTRYQAINNFLSKGQSRYFITAKYLSNGIRVSDKEYPIIKMQWLNGEPLNIFLSKNYNNRTNIEKLLTDFTNLVSQLESYGIAHGDLQHGNIIVKNNQLYLIDYDGMFLPELSGLSTNEVGHINYQHPQRAAKHFNRDIDRFASIIIYLGLKAISINPSLWKEYDDGENILFKKSDFADLQNSNLIHDLSAIPELSQLVKRFIGVCYLEFEKVPTLSNFLNGNFSFPSVELNQLKKIEISRSQYLILDGTAKGSTLEHVGERVEVIGKVTAVRFAKTRFGAPYAFLNMGGSYPNHTFTIVLWSETIAALKNIGISPPDYTNNWTSVTGVISQYNGQTQIYVEQTTQIYRLSGEQEARAKLSQRLIATRSNTSQSTAISSTTRKPNKPKDREAEIFNDLYRNLTSSRKSIPTNAPQQISKPYVPPTFNTTPSQSTRKQSGGSKSNGCNLPLITGIIGGIIGASIAEHVGGILLGAIIGYVVGAIISNS